MELQCYEERKPSTVEQEGAVLEPGETELTLPLVHSRWMEPTAMRIKPGENEPLLAPDLPLSLFGLSEFIKNLPKAGNPLLLEQQSHREFTENTKMIVLV